MSKTTMAPPKARIDNNQRAALLIPDFPQAGPSGSTSHIGETGRKPWADEPWLLIETPSKSQHITHPALHIANEMAHTHNAMLRGLNAIFLQAPHVRQPADVADLLFLTCAWSAWVLDHHALNQTALLPGFECVLGLEPGSLSMDEEEAEGGGLVELLQRVYAYASTAEYRPQTLQALLANLADRLAPLLARQVGMLAGMRELCSSGSAPTSATTPTRAAISAAVAAEEQRANALLRVYLSCVARASDELDRSVTAPMILGLRDATFEGGRGRDWPRLSVPAVHAVADRLAPRHMGAWRFLPCDVWGRPRELRFLG